jgi:CHAD domain-containing protein
MTAQELLLNALEQRYDKYLKERKRCKEEFSEEAVHDLRVATRRLLAFIELLRALVPQPRLQKLHKAFKVQLDNLDDLRDTQVMLAEISEMIETLPTLKPLQKSLQKQEQRLLKHAARDIRSFKLKEVATRLDKVRALVAAPNFAAELTARLFSVVDDIFETVSQRKGRVDPAQPASIHRVRVAFKKFRYMIEIIHPILPRFPQSHLKRMHAYQTLMGDIQDAEVLLHTVREFATAHASYDPQAVVNFYEHHHAAVIATYIENMNELAYFWRATPESDFPWKTKKDKK